MDFEEDLRQQILIALPYDKAAEAELRAKCTSELALIYANWCSRFVTPQPRQVHQSSTLTSNPKCVDPEYGPALIAITEKLECGVAITPHLSRLVKCGYEPANLTAKALSRRRDLDLLLNDWGIHHLHLSTIVEADGFVKRTLPLLFVIFKPSDAYLIDIGEHGDWTRDHMIAVVRREWPTIGTTAELKGILPPASPTTASERKALRNVGMSAPFEFDGKVYISTSMLTTAGTSTRLPFVVSELFHRLKWFEEKVRAEPEFVADAMSAQNTLPPLEPDLHFSFFEHGGYGIVERVTGFRFRLQ